MVSSLPAGKNPALPKGSGWGAGLGRGRLGKDNYSLLTPRIGLFVHLFIFNIHNVLHMTKSAKFKYIPFLVSIFRKSMP